MSTIMTIYGGMQLVARTWRQYREMARVHTERKRIRDTLLNHYEALVETKARAMKTTGVFATEHEHLEAAIVSLAYALDDYRDTV
jgi:hypothetical protein